MFKNVYDLLQVRPSVVKILKFMCENQTAVFETKTVLGDTVTSTVSLNFSLIHSFGISKILVHLNTETFPNGTSISNKLIATIPVFNAVSVRENRLEPYVNNIFIQILSKLSIEFLDKDDGHNDIVGYTFVYDKNGIKITVTDESGIIFEYEVKNGYKTVLNVEELIRITKSMAMIMNPENHHTELTI
ncbi:hypothetical protein [Aeromonas phage AerS_266]|nr:hypothetical protein [Aeromonas phage AerS_266]